MDHKLYLANFPLQPGVGLIVIPSGAINQPSSNADKFPETPTFFLLNRTEGKRSSYYFKERGDYHKKGKSFGLRLFVPVGAKAGDKLVIEWRANQSACARFATREEIAAATPPSKKTGARDKRYTDNGSWPPLPRC